MEKHKNRINPYGNFALIYSGTAASLLGSAIYNFAIMWWMVETTNSTRYSGLILAFSVIGKLIMGPFGGVLADNFNKKYVLVVSDILSGLVCIIVSAMIYAKFFNIQILCVAALLLGVFQAAFAPTSRSIVPEVIDKAQLVRANSLLTNLNSIVKILGPLIGAKLISIEAIGVSGAILINGFSFIISALFELLINYEMQIKKEILHIKEYFTQIKEGFDFVVNQKLIFLVMLCTMFANFLLISFNILIPLYVLDGLSRDSNSYSMILGIESIGVVIMSFIMISIKREEIVIGHLFNALCIMGIILFLIPLTANFIILLILSLCLGILTTYFDVTFISYLQRNINEDFIGRTFSILFTGVSLLMPVAYIIYGFLGDLNLKLAFVVSGILLVMLSFYMWVYVSKKQLKLIKTNND